MVSWSRFLVHWTQGWYFIDLEQISPIDFKAYLQVSTRKLPSRRTWRWDWTSSFDKQRPGEFKTCRPVWVFKNVKIKVLYLWFRLTLPNTTYRALYGTEHDLRKYKVSNCWLKRCCKMSSIFCAECIWGLGKGEGFLGNVQDQNYKKCPGMVFPCIRTAISVGLQNFQSGKIVPH